MEGRIVLKEKKYIKDVINYCKEKNIRFEYIAEDDAKYFVMNNNNFYNLIDYKNNFEKYLKGTKQDKYIDLDFMYLIDLSIIDFRLRLLLFEMIIDIEHYLKIKILNIIETIDKCDGIKIVNSYLENDYNTKKKIHNSIFKKVGSSYYKKIFSNYDIDGDNKLENIPIWEFLKIITFGELVNFYDCFTKYYSLKKEQQDIRILIEIVKLRNAVAHNTLILIDLDEKDNEYPPNYKIVKYLQNCEINLKTRTNKLKNSRIRQITYTLYMFNEVVTSEGNKKKIREDINKLFYKRILLHKEYYKNNNLLKSIYDYFDKIIIKYY